MFYFCSHEGFGSLCHSQVHCIQGEMAIISMLSFKMCLLISSRTAVYFQETEFIRSWEVCWRYMQRVEKYFNIENRPFRLEDSEAISKMNMSRITGDNGYFEELGRASSCGLDAGFRSWSVARWRYFFTFVSRLALWHTESPL